MAFSQAPADFFEENIRPLLADHCYECHSDQARKLKGGLRLDVREGWATGGDSGPALVPGKPDQSLLIEAVRYQNADLEMPPKGRLPAQAVRLLETWVTQGAPDPRTASISSPHPEETFSMAAARSHWAYQPPSPPLIPVVQSTQWPQTDIDFFILAGMEQHRLSPAPDASRLDLVRRVYYDLTGLPPTPEQIQEFISEPSPDAYEQLVDRLLASPRFGERWGRHWLDVVRYGESVTLRGLVFSHAWRYRDYVIEAFNQDLPFDQFIREQLAGDLLPAPTLADRQRQRVATTFLALGNANLENQDKPQLEMDVVDEQLDVISKSFIAQTVTCARCHDHKFDPIPTHDYYAMAGILKSANTLVHGNVSGWVEVPYPQTPEQETRLAQHEKATAQLQKQIREAKNQLAKLKEPVANASNNNPAVLQPDELPGIVIDSAKARPVGEWKLSQFTKRYIGDGYLHDLNDLKGAKTLTFLPTLPTPGRYEVRLAYSHHQSRASHVPITVFSAQGEKTVFIDQRKPPPLENRFVSLGSYLFEPGDQAYVMVGTDNTSGYVTVDALQFLPQDTTLAPPAKPAQSIPASPPEPDPRQLARQAEKQEITKHLKDLENRLVELKKSAPQRPMVMSVEEKQPGDIAIRIRGNVHNKGKIAPRGFLQAALIDHPPAIPDQESGRRQLAQWLTDPKNPLTARVQVNRIWHWLFGSGLVRTPDNFGTTGVAPTHPELLDHLALKFIDQGWSVKTLIREMVTSRVYKLRTQPSPSATATDPENKWRSHMTRRRLQAEALRDTLLMVSRQLDLAMGGSTLPEGLKSDYGQHYEGRRRSVYVPVLRNSLPEIFEVFDFADPSMVVGARSVSTVSPQALYLMNHPFVREQARHTAIRILERPSASTTAQRLDYAYQLILGRPPSPLEQGLAAHFLEGSGPAGNQADVALESWTQLVQTLFGTLDFRYLN